MKITGLFKKNKNMPATMKEKKFEFKLIHIGFILYLLLSSAFSMTFTNQVFLLCNISSK